MMLEDFNTHRTGQYRDIKLATNQHVLYLVRGFWVLDPVRGFWVLDPVEGSGF